MMATFMAAVESTIVATAMPSIVAHLGGFELLAWVFSAYLLAQAVTIPIYGRLADLYGRKRVFFAGAGLFLVGSALSGLSHSMTMLVGFRVVQGFGAGAVLPIAYTIVGDIYTPTERARLQGVLSAVWGVAAVVGPPLGALLVELDWRLVFWVNLPIGGMAIGMIAAFLHERRQQQSQRIDLVGALLLAAGLGAIVLAAGQGSPSGGGGATALLGLGAVVLAVFVAWERRAAAPMLPLQLFAERVIVVGCLGGFTIGAVMMSITAFLPTYIQAGMGRSPMASGLVLGVMSVIWAFASIAAGRVMLRTTYRAAAVIGALALIAGCAVLIAMTPGAGPVWAAFGASVVGIGMGFCNTTFLVSVQAHVRWRQRGVATSAAMSMRMVGQSLGAAVSGALLDAGLSSLSGGPSDPVDRLLSPVTRAALPVAEMDRLVHGVAGSLQNVYVLAAALAVATLGLAIALPPALSPRHQVARE
jgi:EmrB/QacA subfamily drug resistance transporter